MFYFIYYIAYAITVQYIQLLVVYICYAYSMNKNTLISVIVIVLIGTACFFYISSKTAKVTPTPVIPTPVTPTVTDSVLVEQYVRDNITTLAPDKPVLGGTWYVTAVTVDPTTTSGTVSYEDGHIASTAAFTYTRTGDTITMVSIVKK